MGREKTRQRLAIRKAFAPKKKVLQQHGKQHKFESFSQRVARLRIDPIRRDRGRHDTHDLQLLESHFRRALDKWRDLNLSEEFVRFSRRIDGISENLPQVLHHQDTIVEVLLEAVEKSSAVSAEPFLDLVAHLAQDLQAQFAERHFERTVRCVAAVAARHQDVEVVEWSFNCLTWLFKYLERILAAGICPLYDLLAPYLGKERQKPFVSRFAAESLSFLVKRVGKRREAAGAFIKHAFKDLEATSKEKDTELYEHSLIALFLEAIKSVKEALHSTGPTVFSALLDETLSIQQTADATESTLRVIREVWHQLIHHASAENLEPLLDIIYNAAAAQPETSIDTPRHILTSQLLLLASTVKNGHRISKWTALFATLNAQIDILTKSAPTAHKSSATELLATLAVAHQKCPLDAALASLSTLDKVLAREWQEFFPGFCNLYAEQGTDRFRSFVLPRLQRFLTSSWDGQTKPLSVLVPKLVREGAVTPWTLKLAPGFEAFVEGRFGNMSNMMESDDEMLAAEYDALLDLLDATAVSVETAEKIRRHLHTALLNCLRQASHSPLRDFVLSTGFMHLAEKSSSEGWYTTSPSSLKDLCESLTAAASNLTDFPPFFQALAVIFQRNENARDIFSSNMSDTFANETLLHSLTSSSHDMRLASLQIIQHLLPASNTEYQQLVADAIDVEATEPGIESMRYISMKIQNLGRAYKSCCEGNELLAKALPRWMMGLLHVRLSQTWEDVCSALKEISSTQVGEEAVVDVVSRWIGEAPVRDPAPSGDDTDTGKEMVGEDYFSQIRAKAIGSLSVGERASEIMMQSSGARYARVPLLGTFERQQALKVLKAIPTLAEKKGRLLVPVLLSMSGDDSSPAAASENPEDVSESEQDIPQSTDTHWPRRDQKTLLSIFASFQNPRTLYRSTDVYSTLLSLLAHGDVEIQRSALSAILAWKDKTLLKHRADLEKFLDEARLREQLSVFLDSEHAGADGGLPAEDRSVVMPIVLRLVYGRVIARSRDGRGANRKSVFVILSKFSEGEVNVFLDVVLAPAGGQEGETDDALQKRRLGMLNMLKDLLETWRSLASPYVSRVAPAIFACLLQEGESASNLDKAVRTLGMQCLNLALEAGEDAADFVWEEYIPDLVKQIITPRLERFAEENAQGVSALLRMLGIWASRTRFVHWMWRYDDRVLTELIRLLSTEFAKDVVKRFVLTEVLGPFIASAKRDTDVERVVRGLAERLLGASAGLMLQPAAEKEVIEDTVKLITALLPYARTDGAPPALLSAAAGLVLQPSRKVPHSAKTRLLAVVRHFLPSLASSLSEEEEAEKARKDVFNATCASFAYFADPASRTLLVEITRQFADADPGLAEVIKLLDGINAFVPGKLDTPDFERRSQAFAVITEEKWQVFGHSQWRLLLGNLLFYVRDVEELAVRSSAGFALRRFVQAYTLKRNEDMEGMMQQLLGAVEKGMRDAPSELVQAEYLAVLAEVARLPEQHNPVLDLKNLLMDGDEEANLFNNLLHVQTHRRVRAIARLVSIAGQGVLTGRNTYRFCVPLLEGFVLKEGGDGAVMGEAVKALGQLAEWLDWQQVRVLMGRWIRFVKTREDVQERVLRVVDGIAEGVGRSAGIRAKSRTQQGEGDETMELEVVQTKLARTMPGPEKLAQYITEEILPPLSVFLREKDESFVSRRVAVALIAAKFVNLLPQEEFQLRFTPLLTDVCNILRSKDQGSRDMTRRALADMCRLIGPSSFGFIVRELRSALQRGFYLHVLAFSVHSILESTIEHVQPGDLDYCVPEIVDVVVEDVFGNTGKEKDIQEYKADKNTKKEVKGKKSFDSMQLLASVSGLEKLQELVRPLQELLTGHLSVKEVRYVEELLRRIELGTLQNKSLQNRDVLRFCYEIIRDAHGRTPSAAQAPKKVDRKSSKGLVESAYLQPAKTRVQTTSLHRSEATGKIIRFALEMVRSVLKKNKELLTPANVAGFLPVIGDALLNPNEDVKLAALRLFTGIINVPLPRIDEDAPVYITEAARIVEDSQTQSGELEQAALKLISAVLRERRSAPVKVRASTISILLKRLKGDLQVISQQGAAFNLLRAIISRQIVVPELYEIMDGEEGVAGIAVRDHDRTTRDLARSCYVQFLMECPQGPKRWAKQLLFLRANLEYEYAEGRVSVMDVLYLLLAKVGEEQIKDVVKEVFWPLVGVMVNDGDEVCREMASGLVKRVFERAGEEWRGSFVGLVRQLLEKGNEIQKRTALQSWTLYLEVLEDEADAVDFVLESIRGILEPIEFEAERWQLVYWALHTFAAIAQRRPQDGYAKGAKPVWIDARRYVNFPHLWVKQESVALFGLLFKQIASEAAKLDTLPLKGPGQIVLKAGGACELASRHLRLLRDGITKKLAAMVVRNLAFFGRVFAESGMDWQAPRDANGSLAVQEPDQGEDDEFKGLSEDEEDDDVEEELNSAEEKQTALHFLLEQLGSVIRRELGKAITPGPRQESALIPKTAALQLLTALCNTLPDATLQDSAHSILSPLLHLTSPSRSVTAHATQDFKTTHENLITSATELLDNLRSKLGTNNYVRVMGEVQSRQRERREERRAKRKVDAVVRPEIGLRKKAKRLEREKERKREKNEFHRGRRRGW